MQPTLNSKSLVDMTCFSPSVALVFLAVFASINAHCQSVTLSLNSVPEGVQCNEVWTEEALNLRLVETTTEDCFAGSCYFGFSDQALALWPSRLLIDLSSLQNIEAVEIDIDDLCGPNCTRAFLVDETFMNVDSARNFTSGPQTLIVENPTQAFLTKLAISSCEGAVNEIRIYQNTNSIEDVPTVDRKVLRIVDTFGRDTHVTKRQLLLYIYDDGSVEKKLIWE